MSATIDFDTLYQTKLDAPLRALEQKRLSLRSQAILGWVLFGSAASCLLIYLTSVERTQLLLFMMVLFFIGAVIVAIIYYSAKSKYVAAFKESIINEIVHAIEPGCTYSPKERIAEADYKKSGLFLTSYDSYAGDDFVSGTHGSTPFCFSELFTQYRVSNGKSTTWVKIFKGLFFIADFNKNFQCRTYVWSESNPQLNFFSKLFGSFASGLEKVLLESPEFERRFVVYSNDQVESRYILSPSMMEKMVGLQDHFGADLVFSFVDTNVYVAIPVSRDMFEPTVFNPPTEAGLRDYYNAVAMTIGIIDELNLNLRIWNKD